MAWHSEDVNPVPKPLSRGRAIAEPTFDLEDRQRDELAPAFGIAMSVLLSILIWVALGYLTWLVCS